MNGTYGFRVALPPLGRTGPAWYTGLLLIMKVQLLLIFDSLLPHRHQVIIQLTWKEDEPVQTEATDGEVLQTLTGKSSSASAVSLFSFYLFYGVSHSITVQLLSLPV